MIDKERVLNTLNELEKYLAELEDVIPNSPDEYCRSIMNRRTCERLLQISIECVIDTSLFLVRGLRLGNPIDEEDAFTKLERKKIISKGLCERLKDMKRFRNVLVHRYVEVNDEKVYDLIENNLDDFEKFREAVLKAINSKSKY